MPIYVAVGDKVEVPGTVLGEPEGFKDSFWEATVTKSSTGAQCEVQFETIYETEDDDSPKLRQVVEVNKLRPLPPNDSNKRLPQSRQVNDYVDVFYEGGWWLAIVCEVWHKYINVYFPSSNEIYTHITGGDERRVRTRFEYKKNAGGNFEYTTKRKKQNSYFMNAAGERIKWRSPPDVKPVAHTPPESSERHEDEEEKEEQPQPPPAKPSSAKTTPKPHSSSQGRALPKDKHAISLRHLIQYNFIAPGDIVYLMEHSKCRYGTVMEDGRIMVDQNFKTTTKPAAPKEYVYHVAPKRSRLRKILGTQHWQDVYARLGVDSGVRQLLALRNALFNGEPLPPPLADKDACLPKELAAGGRGVKRAVAGPSKRQQVKIPSTEEEEQEKEEEESSGSEIESENQLDDHRDDEHTIEEEVELMETEEEGQPETEEQEDSVLASEFFGPSEDEEDTAVGGKKLPLIPQPHAAKEKFAASKKSSIAAAALVSRKRPASAGKSPRSRKQNKVAARKQVDNILKDLMEDSDIQAAPSGPVLSPLRTTQKKQTTAPKFASKSLVQKAPSSSPSSSSSPSLSTSPQPRQVVAAKPPPSSALASKSSFQNQQPAQRYLPSMAEKKVWCLDNVPQWVLAPALQKALLAELPAPTGIINVDMPLVTLDNGRFSHPGYVVIHFSTPEFAEKAEPVLRQLCIRSSACGIPRPLILRRPWLTKDYPWGKKDSLPGHLPLQVQEPPPPHYAQPNTVEFEMAVHWTQLERAISTARNTLYKEQAYELAKVMSQYLLKQQQGNYKGEIDERALHAPPPSLVPLSSSSSASSFASRGTSFLWIRGVSPTLKVETLKGAFAQHGYPQKAEMLRDKVTKQVNGTAIIQMESVDRATKVARNMQDMEYMLGGSPRPLQVELAKPGGPRGSQSVFDRALRAVVGKHDFEPTTLQLIRIPAVIKETASLENRAAGCLRELMTTHRTEQDAARQVAREARAELAKEQVEQFSMESEKMNRLKALHDGQAYKKMCDLHKLAIRRLRHYSPVHLK